MHKVHGTQLHAVLVGGLNHDFAEGGASNLLFSCKPFITCSTLRTNFVCLLGRFFGALVLSELLQEVQPADVARKFQLNMNQVLELHERAGNCNLHLHSLSLLWHSTELTTI